MLCFFFFLKYNTACNQYLIILSQWFNIEKFYMKIKND